MGPWRLYGVLLGMLLLAPLLWPAGAPPGTPFAANLRLNDDAGLAEQRRAALAADAAGNVYAAWQDARSGEFDIRFAVSHDGGRTFGRSIALGGPQASGTSQERPAIALGPSGEIVVAWQDDRARLFDFDIFASVSVDGGETFSEPTWVSDGAPGSLQFAASVAIDRAGGVRVAWQDFRSGQGNIRLARAQLPGLAFGASVRVGDDLGGAGTQSAPSVAVNGLGTVFVAYHDNRTGNANVYLARSTDRGASFGPSLRVDDAGDSPTAQGLVSLVVDGLGTLYAVWQDARGGNYDIRFAKSTDRGSSFAPSVVVDDGPRASAQTVPRIVVGAAGTLYVVWEDTRNVDSDVYFSWSTDGGRTFAPSVRVDDAGDNPSDPAYQYSPQVAESRTGLVCVVWQDGRSDNGDIYGSTTTLAVGSALRVDSSLDSGRVAPGEPAEVTVRVTSNATGVSGASVSLAADAAGAFGAVVDLGSGTYRTTFTPLAGPEAGASSLGVAITALASSPGFVSGGGQTLLEVSQRIQITITAPWSLLAVGQTMDVDVRVAASGTALPGVAVTAQGSGLDVSSSWGTSDLLGSWKTTVRAQVEAGGQTASLEIGAHQDPFLPGNASLSVPILAEPRPLDIVASSDRWEMMSYETATITVRLTSDGAPVPRAILAASSIKEGNFSAAMDHGDGTYALTFDAPRVTMQSWVTISLTARVGGYEEKRTRVTFLVDPNRTNPPDPTPILMLAEPAFHVVASLETVGITVYVYTQEGYVVSGAWLNPSVSSAYGSVTLAQDHLEGRYTFTFTAAAFLTDTIVLIRVSAGKYGYASNLIRIGLLVTP